MKYPSILIFLFVIVLHSGCKNDDDEVTLIVLTASDLEGDYTGDYTNIGFSTLGIALSDTEGSKKAKIKATAQDDKLSVAITLEDVNLLLSGQPVNPALVKDTYTLNIVFNDFSENYRIETSDSSPVLASSKLNILNMGTPLPLVLKTPTTTEVEGLSFTFKGDIEVPKQQAALAFPKTAALPGDKVSLSFSLTLSNIEKETS